jgi:non-heme chloroperoxidase
MSYFNSFDNARIAYTESGEGQPVVFLPGWSAGKEYFSKQFDALSSKYRLIAMDLRGMGDSEKSELSKITLESWAKDLRELIIQKNLSDIILVGWSMGSFAMWTYYDMFGKDRIAGLVVTEMVGNLGEPGWAEGENKALEKNPKEYIVGFVTGFFTTPPSEDFLNSLIKVSQKTPIDVAKHLNLVLESSDLRPVFSKISTPSLIIYGKNLLFFTEEQEKETIKTIKNSKVLVFEKSKHCPFIEEHERFNKEIDGFIKTV